MALTLLSPIRAVSQVSVSDRCLRGDCSGRSLLRLDSSLDPQLDSRPLETSAESVPCDRPASPEPIPGSVAREFKRIESAALLNSDERSAIIVASDHMGTCLSPASASANSQQTLALLVRSLSEGYDRMPKQNRAQFTSRDEFVNIGLLARTLLGEIVTRRRCQHEDRNPYAKAVAKVILNRDRMIRNHGRQGIAHWTHFLPKDIDKAQYTYSSNSIRDVMFSPLQFSLWNANDHSKPTALCPATHPGQVVTNYRNEKLEMSIGASLDWQKAIEIAYLALHRNHAASFEQETASVRSLFYTSSKKVRDDWAAAKLPSGQPRFQEVQSSRVSGVAITNPECITLWNAATNN